MEESSNRRAWEEELYWQNFHFAHFSLTLPNDFHHRITLPKKFSDYLRTKLPEQIVLKVNRVSWNVNMEKGKDDIMLHGDGWEEFVNAYSLKKDDILVFKYDRHESFEVLLFDGATLCEKEASYFIRKDSHKKNSNDHEDNKHEDNDLSRKTKENLSKEHNTSSKNKNRKNLGKSACARDYFDDQDEMDKTPDEEMFMSEEVNATLKKATTTRERDLPSNACRMRKHNVVKKTTRKKSRGIYDLCYKSNRRKVTELEIENALEKATKASKLCTNSFIVLMRSSCVYRRFFMRIPAVWKPKNFFRKNQEVILKVKEKTWVCKASFSKTVVGFQNIGWKDFVRENFLEEFDVCLFIPSGLKNGRSVLNVRIFRVVSEVVPPTLL